MNLRDAVLRAMSDAKKISEGDLSADGRAAVYYESLCKLAALAESPAPVAPNGDLVDCEGCWTHSIPVNELNGDACPICGAVDMVVEQGEGFEPSVWGGGHNKAFRELPTPAPVAKPRRMRENVRAGNYTHRMEHDQTLYCEMHNCQPVEVCEPLPETCPKCERKVEVKP